MAVVVIGRNEGERLRTCLQSVLSQAQAGVVVYVDSGSTDGSVALARALGCLVVALDLTQPFTAARARNAGFERACQQVTDLDFVQFVDGDCELRAGWLASALAFLQEHPAYAVTAGRLRERAPQASIFNQLCDIEWNTPVGEAKACGGIAMLRADALKQVGGFRASLIAGEEPELCVRLRAAGWRVWRLDAEMAWHDAAMRHWRQWWTRTVRSGFAYAEGAALHGAPPERHWVRESRSIWLWGAGLPVLIAMLALWLGAWALLLLGLYPLQVLRLWMQARRAGLPVPLAYALSLVLGKFAAVWGQFKYILLRATGRRSRLIEYK